MKKFFISMLLVSSMSVQTAVADHPEGTIKVDIYGLVCDFCARALEKVFGKEQAVDNIDVDLDAKVVTIHLQAGQHLDDAKIQKYITDAGYNIEEIHRGG